MVFRSRLHQAACLWLASGAIFAGQFCQVSVASIQLAKWTFETGTTGNPPTATGTDITGLGTAVGTGTASGHHASSSTVWDNPAGNGTPDSLSSNNWAKGDYYQFQTSSLGYEDILLSFSATSSNFGPRDFIIQYSSNGTTFVDTGFSYSTLANAAPNTPWTQVTYQSLYTYNFDLSSITAVDNLTSLFIRLVDNSTTSANGSTVTAAGTSRLDDVTISGSLITTKAVPEPGTWITVGLCLALGGVLSYLRKE